MGEEGDTGYGRSGPTQLGDGELILEGKGGGEIRNEFWRDSSTSSDREKFGRYRLLAFNFSNIFFFFFLGNERTTKPV